MGHQSSERHIEDETAIFTLSCSNTFSTPLPAYIYGEEFRFH